MDRVYKSIYLVIELDNSDCRRVCKIDAFKTKEDADKWAYRDNDAWRNVIKKELR